MKRPRGITGHGRSLNVASIAPADKDPDGGVNILTWMQKPDTPATRGEVFAFGKMLIKDEVAPLIRAALKYRDEQKWWRRLGRWYMKQYRRIVPETGTAQEMAGPRLSGPTEPTEPSH